MGRNLVSHQLVGDKLDRRGYYHVGETISKLLRGTQYDCPVPLPSLYISTGNLRIAEHNEESGVTAPKAKHLLFTSSGRISIISECNYDTGMLLHAIQRNMNEVILGHKANLKLLSYVSYKYISLLSLMTHLQMENAEQQAWSIGLDRDVRVHRRRLCRTVLAVLWELERGEEDPGG